MSNPETILIAAEYVHDARLVFDMLRGDFAEVAISTNPAKAVEDFERHQPTVLVLAFTSQEKTQNYYRALYQSSAKAHAQLHKTLVLCKKEELKQVYALCRQGLFSNYILFWPLGYDSMRLSMEVHQALQQASYAAAGGPTVSQFAAQARRIAGLGELLQQQLAQGDQHIAEATQALQQLGEANRFDFEQLPGRGPATTCTDPAATAQLSEMEQIVRRMRERVDRIGSEKIAPQLDLTAAVAPLRDWASDFRRELAPQMESLRNMQKLVGKVRSLLLVVDDEPLQQKVLQQVLLDESIELAFASNSYEAFAAVHRRAPDLILMDVNLPDISGIEVTRRLKSTAEYSHIPVIMITGHRQKDVVMQSRGAGAEDFIAKPFTKDILLKKINATLAVPE